MEMLRTRPDVEDNYSHAGYLRHTVRTNRLRETANKALKFLKDKNLLNKFDAIAFTGVSGMLIGPTLALKTKKEMIVVRKRIGTGGASVDTGSHSSSVCEGFQGSQRYIIVDDIIATGSTYRRVVDEIKQWAPEATAIGVLCVNELDYEEEVWTDLTTKGRNL